MVPSYHALVSLCLFLAVQSQAKKKVTIDDKVKRLTEWNSKKPVINLNGDRFRQYVKSAPRNYSMIVMFTALKPERQCQMCLATNEEYQVLANSWLNSKDRSSKLFFTMVDFDEGYDAFQSMKLNTAPVIMHFPATGKPEMRDTMNIYMVGAAAEVISRFVEERTGIQIQVKRPVNYKGLLIGAGIMLLLAILLYWKRNKLGFVYNRNGWAVIAVVTIFAMTSGQMWNYIRKPPNMQKTRSGKTNYIHSDGRSQYLVETYLIMLLNCAVMVGFILLNEAKYLNINLGKRKILALVGLVCIAVFFSILLSVFRLKNEGYPYRFLFE